MAAPNQVPEGGDDSPVAEEALRWVVRKLDASSWTARDEAALEAWLRESPAHEAEFRRHTSVVARMSRPDAFSLEVMHKAKQVPSARVAPAVSRRTLLAMLFGSVATALVIGFVALRPKPWVQGYATASATREEVELPDGSRVFLDAGSRMTCEFTKTRRTVQLTAGAAAFRVTSDAARPFEVSAGKQTARVVGTFFEVKLTPARAEGSVSVAVSEGIVEVRSREASGSWSEAVRLTAGKRGAWAGSGSHPVVQAVAAEGFAAWRSGRMFYQDALLSEVVSDLRRYFSGRIELADTALGDLRVTGTLPLDNVSAATELLANTLPVRIRQVSTQTLVIEKGPSPAAR